MVHLPEEDVVEGEDVGAGGLSREDDTETEHRRSQD